MPEPTAADWIEFLKLTPHPEGGHFSENYRSSPPIAGEKFPQKFAHPHSIATSIYFLLQSGEVSQLHRLKSDELWCLLAGGPLTLHCLRPDVGYRPLVLGSNPEGGLRLHAVIQKGVWFGATVEEEEPFALAGCTVVPGFEFRDFEIGNRDQLLAAFPAQRTIIERLTKV